MGCGTFTVKLLLFATNILVMLAGIALIVVGVIAHLHFQEYKDLFKGEFAWFGIVIIVIGCVICLVGFCGCYGAISESSCLLSTYGVLMIAIFLVQVAIGIVVLTQVDNVVDFVNKNFEAFFRQQLSGGDEGSKIIDGIQKEGKCCGVQGKTDYVGWGIDIPKSCCADTNLPCTVLNARSQGCVQYFTDFISGGVNVAGAVTVGVAALEILAIIAACCLASHIRNK